LKNKSDLRIMLGMFGLLTIAAIATLALQLGAPDGPPLSTHAYGITGGVVLARWAEALGYRVKQVEGRPYQLSNEMHLLFMLQPNERYALSDAELSQLEQWVRNGGTLVVAVEGNVYYPFSRHGPSQYASGDTSALHTFGFDLERYGFIDDSNPAKVRMTRPFASEPLADDFVIRSGDTLQLPIGAQQLAAVQTQPLIAMRLLGSGRVIAFSTVYPFTNEGLRDDDDARIVLNLLRLAPPGGIIGFDEYQHGSRQAASLMTWLLSTPAGLAVTLALALVVIYILWTSRRMGRVFVPPELRIRRQPSEYVTAMANLARAAGQSDATLLAYHDTLKQRLGRPYRISSTLADDVFVTELHKANPAVQAERLRTLLQALARGRVSRAEFVRLTKEASEFN
jgi:hypothetical protein